MTIFWCQTSEYTNKNKGNWRGGGVAEVPRLVRRQHLPYCVAHLLSALPNSSKSVLQEIVSLKQDFTHPKCIHCCKHNLCNSVSRTLEQSLTTIWMLIRDIFLHQRASKLPAPTSAPSCHICWKSKTQLPPTFLLASVETNSLLPPPPNSKPWLFLTVKLWARSQLGSGRCNDVYSHPSLPPTPSFLQLLGVEALLGDFALKSILLYIIEAKPVLTEIWQVSWIWNYAHPKQGKDLAGGGGSQVRMHIAVTYLWLELR